MRLKALSDEDNYDEVSIKGEPYNEEAREIMEGYFNDLFAGFTPYNTGGRQTWNVCDTFMLWAKQVV